MAKARERVVSGVAGDRCTPLAMLTTSLHSLQPLSLPCCCGNLATQVPMSEVFRSPRSSLQMNCALPGRKPVASEVGPPGHHPSYQPRQPAHPLSFLSTAVITLAALSPFQNLIPPRITLSGSWSERTSHED